MAIDAPGIREFETGLLANRSPQTVRNIIVLLGRILADARRDGYLRISPMEDVKPLRVERVKKGKMLRPSEVHRLLEQCDDTLRVVVLIALLAGLRRAEVLAVHWTDDPNSPRSWIDLEQNVIRIRQTVYFRHGKHWKIKKGDPAYTFVSPKSRQSIRDVPLSPVLKKELQARYLQVGDKEGLVFQTANGTPLDPNNIICRWLPKRKNAGQSRPRSLSAIRNLEKSEAERPIAISG